MATHNGECEMQNSNYQWFGFGLYGPFTSCTVSSKRIFALQNGYTLDASAIQRHKHAATETETKPTILMVDETKSTKKKLYVCTCLIFFYFNFFLQFDCVSFCAPL